VDDIEAAKRQAQATGFETKPKVAVLLPGSGGEHMINGTDSFLSDVLRAIGAEPVGPKDTKFVPLPAESFVALNPDVIVVVGGANSALAVFNDVRFKPVKAIQDQQMLEIEPDVALRKGSRVDALIKTLHSGLDRVLRR
jgi:ABC-type hemin transport system substrate-binding protein